MKITPFVKSLGVTSSESAFEHLLATLKPTLYIWDYFVNWEKVEKNSKKYKKSLDKLNLLLSSKNFDEDFLHLLKTNPEINLCIPVLLVRDGGNRQTFSIIEDVFDKKLRDSYFDFSIEADTESLRNSALTFVKKSGIINLFTSGLITNLNDYIYGVEAGLDSNGRKNRSGTSMEKVVAAILERTLKNKKYEIIKGATPAIIKRQWGIEVKLDKASRIFDFAISDGKNLILMEVNFYSGGGSKLKSVAGEFSELQSNYLSKNPNIKFVWITDGYGWLTTKAALGDAFQKIDYVWNLDWLSKGIINDITS